MTGQPLVFCALALLPALARSDTAESGAGTGPVIITVQEPAQAGESAPQTEQEPADPPSAPREAAPPPAPSNVPPAPSSEPRSSTSAVPEGQWVYTPQYGWIWMPYAEAYTYMPPSGHGAAYAYVFYPYYGWTWIVAPWLWGWGPWPHSGFHDAWHFAWHGHRWRHPGWWRHWPAPHRGIRPSVGIRPGPRVHDGVRPAPRPFRGGVPSRGIGPAPHRGGPDRPHADRPRPR